jgi:hypothetical protein
MRPPEQPAAAIKLSAHWKKLCHTDLFWRLSSEKIRLFFIKPLFFTDFIKKAAAAYLRAA